jgi:DNA-binding response OmpR family regulator
MNMNDCGYILLVEDEQIIQEKNKRILERRGYRIRQAYSLAEARAIIGEEPPADGLRPCAIVLDIQLPDGSGLNFLNELRQSSTIPVLMLTAMGTPEDIVKGLATGGDDYLTKPYELPVFLMRVEALLRRASLMPNTLGIGTIRIDTASGRAYINGEDMCLQQKEYSLLQQFIQNPNKVMSAEALYEKVWGLKMIGDDNALKKVISKLRKKLEDSGYTIVASRGEGYCFERI